MGKAEIREIAAILKRLLSSAPPEKITRGKNAGSLRKARHRLNPEALDEARSRVADLLNRFPVYPELDLDYLDYLEEAFLLRM